MGTLMNKLSPRKMPTQTRSQVTVDAIFEATIQVLSQSGATTLTTNHIAERAGVSVGTLYQYFPGKEALLYALVGQHLERASEAVELACKTHRGMPLNACSDAFVNAYLDAKTKNPETSRALYHASTELDMRDLGAAMTRRLHLAVHCLLASVPDVQFGDLDSVVFNWVAIVTGGTRQVFDEEGTTARLPAFRAHLIQMSRAYLNAVENGGGPASVSASL